ncbi:hypothetical protein CEP52_009893 [Fusarium oligoseptatum]|uniref:Protein kinase domain-containing protein n=1 Tax=Fusarium oligoseptatum TaxID=2604345 RepID=A0A428TB06_9HYPO|nr:hypothetical protein CEP52_009893 [Fusarium oligoseptatum]
MAPSGDLEPLEVIEPIGGPDLRDEIFRAMQENNEGKKFIPANAIARLASRGAVDAELGGMFKGASLERLVDYVFHKPAMKVFLILVVCKNIRVMANIYNSRIGDEHLPLGEQVATNGDKQLQPPSQNTDPSSVLDSLFSCRLADREEFLERQWSFMAPVFTRKQFAHKLHPRCPLPFIPFTDNDQAQHGAWRGMSGSIQEIKVHEAHQKVLPQDGKRIRVALKTISPQMSHYFQQEEETLSVIQNIDHDHLIKPIASYQYHNHEDGCFLFPWAERGNLKEFWKTEKEGPLKDPEMMAWMLKQMCGLCDALGILHSKGRRHGDIKPENILLFEEGDYNGALRIADVGLAKFHDNATERRELLKEITKTRTGTTRYLSPEFVHRDQIPRVFDVWALGCVFVEFLIWTLHGYDRLSSFRKASCAYFWDKVNDEFVINIEVRTWIDNLEQILRGSETALESLLDLIQSHMLVPNWKDRHSSVDVHAMLAEICHYAQNDTRYLSDPEVESRARTNPPRLREFSQNLTLPEMPKSRLAPLSQKQGSFRVHVVGPDDGVDNTGLMVNTTTRAQQQVHRLNKDTWQSKADNKFAQSLFSNPDWSHRYPAQAPSKLCRKCTSLDIWQPGFEFGGLVGDIRARSKGCDLCLLFTQAASELKWEDSVRLLSRRFDSVMRILPDGPTILSLYSDPEQVPASPDAQIGYPLLPKPGSSSQFAFIKEWLRVCQETHNHGHLPGARLNSSELPTRVIDLGSLDKPKLQLIAGEAMVSHEYVALSHCWGKGMMFRAMKENIKALADSIDFRRLPRTFQEAIRTTRCLSVRYLWIDSLCIIQDDDEDWKREAARMQQVFSNATCVIAASSAGSYVCKFIDNFAQDMEEAPLNKRGWVLQERALARRSIHFTSTQVYLECGKGVHCESLMKLANDKAAFLGDSDFPNSILEYYKGGRIVLSQNLFKMYSTLKFTKSSDRPIAISGLEKRLMSAFKTRGGYGVFQAFFERSLLWQRPESGSLARIAYPSDRNVPSWSWMSYDGSITYVDAPFEEVDWTKDYESPFEAKTGRQYWGTNENNPSPIIKSKSARKFSSTANPNKVLEKIKFDLKASAYHQLGALRCIVIGKAKSSEPNDSALHYVLVITASSSGNPDARILR